MEKLNIAELLKDCPSGTKLYSTVHGAVELVDIRHNLIHCKCSYCVTFVSFNSDGRWVKHTGECIIFPSKDQRDWNKFHRPFKDGDILAYDKKFESATIFIYRYDNDRWNTSYYAGLSTFTGKFYKNPIGALNSYNPNVRFATEEEKLILFSAIKENGYKWNAETKTLEKLIEPKFKVWDTIENKNNKTTHTINYIYNDSYGLCDGHVLYFKEQDQYELAPNKFDIITLKPFDKVLVRQRDEDYWKPAFWGGRSTNKNFPFITSFGSTAQAIPFKSNEWLVGTTEDCADFYKTWK